MLSPVTEFKQPANRQNGELGVAHTRNGELGVAARHTPAVKKRAPGTFFEDNKTIQKQLRETFYLAKSFPNPSKIRFIKRFRFLRKAI